MCEQVAVVAATRAPPRDLEGFDDDPGASARQSSLPVACKQARGAIVSRAPSRARCCQLVMKWICCQLGAREHYAVPRALQLGGVLGEFITDLWLKRFKGRFHAGLASARVTAPNVAA